MSISILIVEDIAEMRLLMKELLQGIKELKIISLARNSAEARVEIHKRRPDLILLDEVLPGESSFEFLQEFCVVQKLPVILLTSMSEDEIRPLPPGSLGRIRKPSWKTLIEDRKRFQDVIFRAHEGALV